MAYATLTDYETYSGGTPTVDITILLERASEMMDYVSLNRAAKLSDTSALHPNLVKAVCAQVEFWLNSDEDREFNGTIESFEAVSNKIKFKNGSLYLAPRAKRLMFLAGLLHRGVLTNSTVTKSDYYF